MAQIKIRKNLLMLIVVDTKLDVVQNDLVEFFLLLNHLFGLKDA